MLEWLADSNNSKPLGLLLFFVAFLGILWFVFGSKKRGQRLESYKDIPFLDEEPENKGASDVRSDSDMKGKQ